MLTALGLAAVAVLILANGFFVAAEFAFVAAKRGRLEDRASTGDRKAARAVRVHKRLSFMLSGAQLGITVTSLVVGFIAEPALGRALEPVMGWIGLPESSRFGVALTTGFVLATIAQMVVGELAPKNLAIARPEPVALAVGGPTLWFMRLAGPVIRLFDGSANRLLRLVGIEPTEELQAGVSVEELDLIVEESAERGELTDQQASLLMRAIEFGGLRAASAMIPWNRVETVPTSTSCAELQQMLGDAYSRFPVVDEDGQVTGVVHVKDLLHVEAGDLAATGVGTIARAALVVPESAGLRVVLDGLRHHATEMAIVTDEYGGPAGIVTLEDLVEELVGDIGDEYDVVEDEPSVTPHPDRGWLVPGALRVDEVARATGVALPDEDDYETVAGLLLARLQRLPSIGDEVQVGDVRLAVTAMDHWAITEIWLDPPAGSRPTSSLTSTAATATTGSGSGTGSGTEGPATGPPAGTTGSGSGTGSEGPASGPPAPEGTGGEVSTPTAMAIAVAMLAANGFFVAAEFALLASRATRIEQLAAGGDKRARHALAGKRELSLMLAGAQLGITVCSLILGAVAEPAVAHLIEDALHNIVDLPEAAIRTIGFAVALSIVVFLHMVVGEMAPKSWAISHPEQSALALARPFRGFAVLLRPVIRLLNALANGLVRLVGVEPQDELAQAHSPADLLLLIDESAHHGSIDPEEHRLFARSLELSGLDAAGAMTPRRLIVAVPASASADVVGQTARSSGRSRIVVHAADLDHVVGVVHVKDVLRLDPVHRATTTAAELARPALVVHEGKLLEDLLVEMRGRHQHLAVVVDEHGVVSGLVTLEDVIEELIGDFEDESDRGGRRARRLPDGSWLVAGDLRPDELAERVDIVLPEGDWTTVAGFAIAALDHIPRVGETIRGAGFTLEVTAVDGFAVTQLRLTIDPLGASSGGRAG